MNRGLQIFTRASLLNWSIANELQYFSCQFLAVFFNGFKRVQSQSGFAEESAGCMFMIHDELEWGQVALAAHRTESSGDAPLIKSSGDSGTDKVITDNSILHQPNQ